MPDENKNPSKNSPATMLLMGLFAAGMGVFIILMSVDIIHADPNSIHAPRWVITLAGIMFTSVGLYIMSTGLFSASEQKTPIVQWMQYFLILAMLTAFAVIFLWVGFGSGEREFSGSSSVGFVTVSGKGNDMMGRIMFGFGGIISTLMAGSYAYSGARKIINGPSDED